MKGFDFLATTIDLMRQGFNASEAYLIAMEISEATNALKGGSFADAA